MGVWSSFLKEFLENIKKLWFCFWHFWRRLNFQAFFRPSTLKMEISSTNFNGSICGGGLGDITYQNLFFNKMSPKQQNSKFINLSLTWVFRQDIEFSILENRDDLLLKHPRGQPVNMVIKNILSISKKHLTFW